MEGLCRHFPQHSDLQLRQIKRVSTPVGYVARTGDVRDGEIRGGAVLTRRFGGNSRWSAQQPLRLIVCHVGRWTDGWLWLSPRCHSLTTLGHAAPSPSHPVVNTVREWEKTATTGRGFMGGPRFPHERNEIRAGDSPARWDSAANTSQSVAVRCAASGALSMTGGRSDGAAAR